MTREADRRFFAEMWGLADGPDIEATKLVFDDIGLRLRTSRELLQELRPVIDHALCPVGDVTTAIEIVAVIGPPPAAPPWDVEHYLDRNEIAGLVDGPLRAVVRPEARSLSMADLEARRGIFWCPDAAELPPWESTAPLRLALHWLLPATGLRMVHAAAVGDDDGAVLVAGPSGAGKSTTAVAAVAGGMRTAGEDYVLVDLRPGRHVAAIALYDVATLGSFALEAFPHVAAHRVPSARMDKTPVSISAAFPGAFAPSLPLRAIVIPHVGPRTGACDPLSPVEALRALASSTLVQLPADDIAAMRELSVLVRRLPAYRLHVGPDLERIGPALAALARAPLPA